MLSCNYEETVKSEIFCQNLRSCQIFISTLQELFFVSDADLYLQQNISNLFSLVSVMLLQQEMLKEQSNFSLA